MILRIANKINRSSRNLSLSHCNVFVSSWIPGLMQEHVNADKTEKLKSNKVIFKFSKTY